MDMMDEDPELLERKHVREVYSQIADHFSDTRYKPWPKIAEFLRKQPVGSLIADVGCGNGKYLGTNPLTYTIGSDNCSELVAIGHGRGHQVTVCDCLNLPYRTNLFDVAICIAVIHHLSTEERRLQALCELVRIVRPGGRLLVYVWALEQEKKRFSSQDVLVPWHLQPKYQGAQALPKKHGRCKPRKSKKRSQQIACGLQQGASSGGEDEVVGCPGTAGDAEKVGSQPVDGITKRMTQEVEPQKLDSQRRVHSFVDESSTIGINPPSDTCSVLNGRPAPPSLSEQGYKTFQRFYHVFCAGELAHLLTRIPSISIHEEYYDHENWCVLAKKIALE